MPIYLSLVKDFISTVYIYIYIYIYIKCNRIYKIIFYNKEICCIFINC